MDLAAHAGLHLDPWEADVLSDSLNQRRGDRWAALEVGLIVPRQNGKGSIIEARQLAALFLTADRQTIYSAHQFKTAKAMYRRLRDLVKTTPDLHALTGGSYNSSGDPTGGMYRNSNEETGIELTDGRRINYFARSNGSGRGFTGDTMIFDEAFDLDPELISDMMPMLSAVKNPQVWYVSSAGMESSQQLALIRDRGLLGTEPRLMYREWSAEDNADPDDINALLTANPAIGYRLDLDYIQLVERHAMTDEAFKRERLGIWRPPDSNDRVISAAEWSAQAAPGAKPTGRVVFAAHANRDSASAAISVAGVQADGSLLVTLVEHRPGVAWVAQRLAELKATHNPLGIVVDAKSDSSALIQPLAEVGVKDLLMPSTQDVARGCGEFRNAVLEHRLFHTDDRPLNDALANAKKRDLAGQWAWDRRDYMTDLSPLVSATLAVWGLTELKSKVVDVSASFW